MSSPKWNIFRVANYLQIAQALVILAVMIYQYADRQYGIRLGFFFLFCLVFIAIIVNNCMNAHIMHAYFPDKSLPSGKRKFYLLTLILYIIVNLGILALTIFGFSEEIKEASRDRDFEDNTGWIILAFLTFDLLLSIFIIIIQSRLPGLLSRNNRQYIQQLVDEIGKPG
jgi:carbon starvation protein CstA